MYCTYQQKDRHSFQPQVGGRGPGRSLPTENILARAPQGPRRGRFREKDTFIVLRFATVAYVTLCVQCAELHWKESCQLKFGVGFGPHWYYDYCYWLIILFFFSLFFRFVTVAYATLCVSLRLPDKSCQLLFSRFSGECLVDLLLQGELFSVVVGSFVLNDAIVIRLVVLVVRTNGVLTFVLNIIILVVL